MVPSNMARFLVALVSSSLAGVVFCSAIAAGGRFPTRARLAAGGFVAFWLGCVLALASGLVR